MNNDNALTHSFAFPQGCVLYSNYWPMLAGILYILVPMPYLFFNSSGGG